MMIIIKTHTSKDTTSAKHCALGLFTNYDDLSHIQRLYLRVITELGSIRVYNI
jgi:hypothetical protein